MATTRDAAPTATFFDPLAHVPDGAALRAARDAGDPAAALAVVRGLTAPDDVIAALWAICGDASEDDHLPLTAAIDAADDGAPLTRTLRAMRYMVVGWSIRSHARAEHVSADQFEQFHDWLRRAERLLFDVCAEHPGFIPAWKARITTARGLELGHGEARRRYDRLAALDPQVFAAQQVYLQQILPKWSGSWEETSRFVAECADGAAPGALGPALVVDLAIERYVDGEKATPPEMVDRVRGVAAGTVLHPDHVRTAATAVVHANLALFFSLADLPAEAQPHFEALGDAPVQGMWGYYEPGAERLYRKHRDAAAKAAARSGARA
ncbi:hypothetical protein ACFWEJ_17600 [Promicromonospora sp. NPDC060204]|uniref:hypothetical protein n=1 Tax=Promicromonospora sp. NPDC060204 TaxID=3347071 RepID=UPI003663BA29